MTAVLCRAQGLFSGAGHRCHSGRVAGSADCFIRRYERPAAGLGSGSSLQDPAVAKACRLSSALTASTPRSTADAIQINLKPMPTRRAEQQSISSGGFKDKLSQVDGITLFMQLLQDLTVEDRVSRTQYQYTLEDVDAKELNL